MRRNSLILIVLALFGVFTLTSAEAYTPPVGIPDPGMWGVTHPLESNAPDSATKCPNWPANESASCYYIDNTSQSCSDSLIYGTPDTPRCSLERKTYTAGDYIEMHGGPYNYASSQTRIFPGTADNPIWIRGTNESKPIITGEWVVKGSYIIMENLLFDRGALSMREHNASTLDHAVIRNSIFTGDGTAGGGSAIAIVSGSDDNWIHHIIVYNNDISYYGKYDNYEENDYHGVKPAFRSHDVWILNNRIHHLGGDSVQVGEASMPTGTEPYNIYVGKNTFYGNFEDDIDLKKCRTVILSENDLGTTDDTVTGSDGAALVIHNYSTDIWVINNYIHDNAVGVISTSASNVYLVGNHFDNINSNEPFDPNSYRGEGRAIAWYSTQNVFVVDNTIFNADVGIQGRPDTSTNIIHGNTITGRTLSDGAELYIVKGVENADLDHNLINNSAIEKIWLNESREDLTLADLKAGGECNDCISDNPTFEGDTLVPHANSPATDQNEVQTNSPRDVYTTFATNFDNRDIAIDLNGVSRPQGNGWDIGAYELSQGSEEESQGILLLFLNFAPNDKK